MRATRVLGLVVIAGATVVGCTRTADVERPREVARQPTASASISRAPTTAEPVPIAQEVPDTPPNQPPPPAGTSVSEERGRQADAKAKDKKPNEKN